MVGVLPIQWETIFLSGEGPMLETLDYTIRIGSTPTILYFDLYNYTVHSKTTTLLSKTKPKQVILHSHRSRCLSSLIIKNTIRTMQLNNYQKVYHAFSGCSAGIIVSLVSFLSP